MKDNPISLHAVGCLLMIAGPLVPPLVFVLWLALLYSGLSLHLAWALLLLAVVLEIAILYGAVRFVRTARAGGWGWLALGWSLAIGLGFAYGIWGLLALRTLAS